MDPHFLKHHPGEFRNLKFQSALGGEFNHLFSPDSLQCIFRFLHGLPVAHEGLTILHDAVPCDRESSAQFFLLHIPIRTDLSLSLLRIQALPIWSVPIGIEAMIAAAAKSTIDLPGETAPRLTDDLADPMTLHEALSAFQLILCCFPDFRSDQCLMISLHIVLVFLAFILDHLLRQEIDRVGLLHEKISFVLLVLQHTLNCFRVPSGLSGDTRHLLCFQLLRDAFERPALKEIPVDALHYLALLRVDDKIAVLILVVSHETLGVDHRLTSFEFRADAPGRIFRDVPALLLCKGGEDREEELSGCRHRIDVLLLEVDRNTEVLELPGVVQAVSGVTSESGN